MQPSIRLFIAERLEELEGWSRDHGRPKSLVCLRQKLGSIPCESVDISGIRPAPTQRGQDVVPKGEPSKTKKSNQSSNFDNGGITPEPRFIDECRACAWQRRFGSGAE